MTAQDETWLPVVGWEELYEVSSHGRMRSRERVVRCGYGKTRALRARMLRPWLQKGYPTFALIDGLRKYRTYVHRFVCEAFNGPAPSPEHEVAHNDGDPANCHFRNLRWATHAENEADKIAHGTNPIGERHPGAKLTEAQVIDIRKAPGKQRDIARTYGVTPATICLIKKGRLWRHAA